MASTALAASITAPAGACKLLKACVRYCRARSGIEASTSWDCGKEAVMSEPKLWEEYAVVRFPQREHLYMRQNLRSLPLKSVEMYSACLTRSGRSTLQ